MRELALHPQLRQELKFSPQMLQSIRLLQMNSQELLGYLDQVREENPLIEQEEPYDLREEYEALRRRASWLDAGLFLQGELPEQGGWDREADSLHAFLLDQLDRMRLPKDSLALCRFLARMVDEDGYLSREDLEALPLEEDVLRQGVERLQSLEPAGVGARDLSECLILQLRRRGEDSPLLERLAEDFLPQLGRHHYAAAAKALKVRAEEVRAAAQQLSALDPHPGRRFEGSGEVAYVRPDVFVVEEAGALQVLLNEYYLPRITISGYYTRLLREADGEETRDYLKEKLRQAKWVISALERRGSTLRRCAEAVAEVQAAFFLGNSTELIPMSFVSLAGELGVDPTTVSRAVRGKYLQCRQGLYPLRYFFSGAVSGLSQQAVKQKILSLVKEEDPAHPLSDQALCAVLAGQGIHVARRTVAKYRIQLGILSSTARRQ